MLSHIKIRFWLDPTPVHAHHNYPNLLKRIQWDIVSNAFLKSKYIVAGSSTLSKRFMNILDESNGSMFSVVSRLETKLEICEEIRRFKKVIKPLINCLLKYFRKCWQNRNRAVIWCIFRRVTSVKRNYPHFFKSRWEKLQF